jgi:hypothetical protein
LKLEKNEIDQPVAHLNSILDIGRMCAPQRSDQYATLAEALEDLAICQS